MTATLDKDLALPALFQKSWGAAENADSLTDTEIEVPNAVFLFDLFRSLQSHSVRLDMLSTSLSARILETFDKVKSMLKNSFCAQEAVRWLQSCSKMVAILGLFSSNEQAEDIATADLKYLLVPYLWGDLLSRSRTQDLQKRTGLLNDASQLLRGFLERCDEYALLGPDEKAMLLEAQGQGSLDSATRRTQKIARIKMEKAAREKLDALKMQDLRKKRLRELEADEGLGSADEEMERDVWLTQIQLRTLKAANLLGSLKQEIELLTHAASLPEDVRVRPAQPPRAEVMEQLHTAAAALSMGSAQQMRANVFLPSHNLPTVTLAEQADREIAAAQRAAEAQARAEDRRARAKAEDKDGDAQTLRQRAWDDWKDDNPRGAGNSKLLSTA